MLTVEEIVPELPGVPGAAGLVPLFRGVWRVAPLVVLDRTPAGTRVIADMTDGVIVGRGITARLEGAAADWFTVGPDGTGTLDWRGRVVTDDGAVIYLHGSGRRRREADGSIVGACLFETDAEPLRWLNTTQAVYRATLVGEGTDEITYHDEYFELL